MPNAPPRKQSSTTVVDPGGPPADGGRYVAIVPPTITTSSSSSSSTTNATQSNKNTPSDSLSLRQLNANPDINTKHAYIIRHATGLQWKLGRERVGHELQLHDCYRALRKLHPKPLEMEKDVDVTERQVRREKFEEQIPGLEERLREIEEGDVLIQRSKDELTAAVGGLDEYYVEWTLMPSVVWDLMQLG